MKSIACWIVSETINAYCDGELTPGERAAIERHLASCARCAHNYRQVVASTKLCGMLSSSAPPSSRLLASIAERVSRANTQPSVRRLPLLLRFPPFQEIAEEWAQAPVTTCAALLTGAVLGIIRVCA
jgi:anti-sigma factor RsiW